ncbi:MAG: hypothetical protein NVS3B26_29280 [Mycobacteriales bacterium]
MCAIGDASPPVESRLPLPPSGALPLLTCAAASWFEHNTSTTVPAVELLVVLGLTIMLVVVPGRHLTRRPRWVMAVGCCFLLLILAIAARRYVGNLGN